MTSFMMLMIHARADIGSRERAVMALESRAVLAQVTKHFVTFLVKHVIIMANIFSCVT